MADVEPTGRPLIVHEMMFNRVRDGRLAETWAMTASHQADCFKA